MRNRTWLILVILLFVSCSGRTKVPHDVMQPDKMQKVLWDVFQAEVAAQQISGKDSTVILSDKIKELTGQAFKLNKVSDSDFFRSYNWYIGHPEIFSVMLDSLYNYKSVDPETKPSETPSKERNLKKIKKDLPKSELLKEKSQLEKD